ncbi:MAG: hypothetical protein LBQ44_05045 [Treponema sp.]|jgi:hypothetical protein|nr:hypothetical protein [Treponema sp.]
MQERRTEGKAGDLQNRPYRFVRQLNWGNGILFIAGKNAGIEYLVTRYFGENRRMVDFLNKNLERRYFTVCFDTLMAYDARIRSGSIYELHYPPPLTAAYKPFTRERWVRPFREDPALVDIMLMEYLKKIDEMKFHVSQWRVQLDRWFQKNVTDLQELVSDLHEDWLPKGARESTPSENGLSKGLRPEDWMPKDARPESGRLGNGRPESARPENASPESARPESARPGNASPAGKPKEEARIRTGA